MFHSEEDKAKLCKVIIMKEVNLPRECVLFGRGSLRHAGDGWKGSHHFRNHLHMTLEDVDLQDAFAYGDLMQREM